MDESRVRTKKSKLKTNLETGCKTKKKIKSAIAKVVETTELISQFSKSSKTSSSSNHKKAQPEIKGISKHKSSNKFKTGGIVATAVQPIRRTKKIKLPSTVSVQVQQSPNLIKLNESCTEDSDGENLKKFVKKVKSKIKKKKSK